MKHLKPIRIVALIAIFVFSISTYGCIPHSRDQVATITQICYSIPGAKTGKQYTTRFDFLDTDDYGRKLFAFSNPEGVGIAGVFITQKYDNKYVYYYDNVSYFCTDRILEYSPEQLDALKQANDWNKPLNEEKIIKREYVNKFLLGPDRNSAIEGQDAIDAFCDTMGVDEKIEIFPIYFDFSQSGQEIFFVNRQFEKSKIGEYDYEFEYDYFLMILNADGTYDPETYLIKIDDLDKSNELLAEIKTNNDWVG